MKNKVLYIISQIFLYLFASVAAFLFTYILFTDAINNLRMILHYLPVYLTLINIVYICIAFYHLAKIQDETLLAYKIKVHSLILLSISAFSLLFGFINTFVSFDGNFLSGGPAKSFPLSFLIIDLALIIIFAYLFFVYRKAEKVEVIKEKHPRTCRKVLYHIYVLFAMYFLGTFFFGFYSIDLSFEHVLGTIPVYILLVFPSAILIGNEFLKAKGCAISLLKTRFVYGLITLGITFFLSGWVFIYQRIYPNYLVSSMTAIFPVDFAISVNLGPLILFLLGLIPSLVFVLSYLLLTHCKICQNIQRKRQQKEETLEN